MKARDNVNTYDIYIVPKGETNLLFSDDKNDAERGCIGHLRTDFGHNGNEFWHTWCDHKAELKTQEFKDELDAVINYLREDGNILHNLTDLRKFCYSHHDGLIPSEYRDDSYGYKIITRSYCYYIRSSITQGDYNAYCYCYVRERLEQYLASVQEKEG